MISDSEAIVKILKSKAPNQRGTALGVVDVRSAPLPVEIVPGEFRFILVGVVSVTSQSEDRCRVF